MRIVTWNINSLRLRLNNINRLKKELNPDIICLQETKVPNDLFPLSDIKSMGFDYVEFHGSKSYNGVAIISKVPLIEKKCLELGDKDHTRHISCILPDGTELHNFYVPAGGDEPDPVINDKFAFKLRYLDDMASFFEQKRKPHDKMIILGDINTAPYPNDVWSHTQLLKVISHTPIEIEKMEKLYKSADWVDTSRHFVPLEQKLYSWWSYRNQDWRKSDRGRRLDHIWITKPLLPTLKHSFILKDARDWELPSDHVPVIMDIEL